MKRRMNKRRSLCIRHGTHQLFEAAHFLHHAGTHGFFQVFRYRLGATDELDELLLLLRVSVIDASRRNVATSAGKKINVSNYA